MAQYQYLPIYKAIVLDCQKTKTFSRDFKYSLGDKIRNECVELVVHIYKATPYSDHIRRPSWRECKNSIICEFVKNNIIIMEFYNEHNSNFFYTYLGISLS
jgi:hypothetical protein